MWQLTRRFAELLELIFDKEMMQQTLVRFNVDIKARVICF